MPTYEYKCDECGHEFEAFQSIKDEPIKVCPVCNAKVHRIINGGAGVIFKGSGFYITDYKHAHGVSNPLRENSDGNKKSDADTDKDKKKDKDSDSPSKKGDSSD